MTKIASPDCEAASDPPGPRRSQRKYTVPKRYGYDGTHGYGYTSEVLNLQQNNINSIVSHCLSLQSSAQSNMYLSAACVCSNADFESGAIDHPDPLIFVTLYNKKLTADTYNYHEVTLQPDWQEF